MLCFWFLLLLEEVWPGTESNRRRQPFQGCALPLSYLAIWAGMPQFNRPIHRTAAAGGPAGGQGKGIHRFETVILDILRLSGLFSWVNSD